VLDIFEGEWISRLPDEQGLDLRVLNRSSDHSNVPQFSGLAVRRI